MTVRLSYTYIYYYIQGLILYYFLSMEICQISLASEVLLRPPAPNSDCARQSPNRFGFCARWHVVSSFAGAKVRQLYDMTKFSDNFFQNFFQSPISEGRISPLYLIILHACARGTPLRLTSLSSIAFPDVIRLPPGIYHYILYYIEILAKNRQTITFLCNTLMIWPLQGDGLTVFLRKNNKEI